MRLHLPQEMALVLWLQVPLLTHLLDLVGDRTALSVCVCVCCTFLKIFSNNLENAAAASVGDSRTNTPSGFTVSTTIPAVVPTSLSVLPHLNPPSQSPSSHFY